MSDSWDEERTVVGGLEPFAPASPTAQLAARSQAFVLWVSGTGLGRRHRLADEEVHFGRGSSAGIKVAAADVSRDHARIVRNAEGGYLLEDLESQNGTFINGTRVERQVLRSGDQIQLGTASVFLFAEYSPLEDLVFQEQKMESVGRLAGGLAHDFNNLMSVVLADIEYLRRAVLKGDGRRDEMLECMNNIEAAAGRAARLTKQILGFARRGKSESRPVDLHVLVEDVLNVIRPAASPSIAISVSLPDVAVMGDAAQLHQALTNLCWNACDAMPDGGALTIGAELVARPLEAGQREPAAEVKISVRDTGRGMDQETRDKLFEPFFSTKDPETRAGLGLATVYGIVKSHGGRLDVDSEVGRGSVFHVILPAAAPLTPELSERPTEPAAPAVGHVVLLVEDVSDEREAATRILRQAGCKVIEARDGREAIRLYMAHRGRIDLVVLDLILPNLSGKDTFRWLRRINPRIKVLLTSAYVEERRVSDLIAEGARGFLPKPYVAEPLLAAVRSAFTGSQDRVPPLR